MATFRAASMIAVLLLCVPLVHAADPKPTYKEYKEGLEAKANATKAAVAKDAKMAAVDKVIALMEELKAKVLSEGAAEAKTYNDFACFCKTTQKQKSESIQEGEDSSATLSAEIESLASQRDTLDTQISKCVQDIKTNEGLMADARKTRHSENEVYMVDEADLSAAIEALEGAIAAMKASKAGAASLIQVQSLQKTLQRAMLLADSLGLISAKNRQITALFLQDGAAQPPPEVEMEDYKFHSDSIIETLEKLLKDFTTKKNEVDAAEVESVKQHQLFMQDKTNLVQNLNAELETAKGERSEKIAEIEKTNMELSVVAATLLDDKEYATELNQICSDKAKTWDQRSTVRANELQALTAALEIVKSTVSAKTRAATVRLAQKGPARVYLGMHYAEAAARSDEAMMALEAETEAIENGQAPPVAFLQRRAVQSHRVLSPGAAEAAAREAVVMLLRKKGEKLKSTLLTSLATNIGKDDDPFAKIKTLIQQLIDKLLSEETAESNQKGWCDKEISANSQKRDYASEEVLDLNAKMAKLEASRDRFKESVDLLAKEISDLEANRATAEKERSEESAENKITVEEAEVGLEAIDNATDIIFKFYKSMAKETVDLSLAQKGPLDDAPDAGFKIGEAYTASQGEASGILGMMDVIKSDFQRTISETKKAEAQAEQDHLAFMTETGKSLAEKNVAKTEKKKLLDEAIGDLGLAADRLNAEMEIVVASIKELMTLKETCIDTGMSYAERKENREEEIEALKKALCILGNYMEPSAVEEC